MPPVLLSSMVEVIPHEQSSGYAYSVFATPHIVFKRPLRTPAPAKLWPNAGEALVRGELEHFQLSHEGREIAGRIVWLEEGTAAAFVPDALLPSEALVLVQVRIRYEVERDGSWQPLPFSSGRLEFDEHGSRFKTRPLTAKDRLTPELRGVEGLGEASPAQGVVARFPARLMVQQEPQMHGTGVLFPVRPELDEMAVFVDGQRQEAAVRAIPGYTSATLEPVELLPAQAAVRVTARGRWSRLIQGEWVPVSTSEPFVERSFTAAAYDTLAGIHPDNLATAYPWPRQLHFHAAEHPAGHLSLRRRQSALLSSLEGQQLSVRFSRPSAPALTVPATYDPQTLTFHFAPLPLLEQERIYTLQLVAAPPGGGAGQVLYQAPFRTSRYATFGEKWDAMQSISSASISVDEDGNSVNDYQYLQVGYRAPESFDAIESGPRSPLIQMQAVWEGNRWYEEHFQELYSLVRAGTVKLTWDRPDEAGLPPTGDVYVSPGGPQRMLTDDDVAADALLSPQPSTAITFNHVARILRNDHRNVQAQLTRYPGMPAWQERIYNDVNPIFDSGSYPARLEYRVPGRPQPTTERTVYFFY